MAWKLVYDPFKWAGYPKGFDPNRTYEFGREEWDETKFFKLSDCSPYFNVSGLYFREATQPHDR